MEQLYLCLSSIIIIGAIMVITSLNPIHSVFWLVLVFLNSSILLLLLGYDFLPLMIIIVYVGAIAILFLFVIMMLDVIQLKKVEPITHTLPIILCVFINSISYIIIYFKDFNLIMYLSSYNLWFLQPCSHIELISKLMYTHFSYLFIIMSLLLLVAMVGAIVLVLDLGSITRRQLLVEQHQRLINKN